MMEIVLAALPAVAVLLLLLRSVRVHALYVLVAVAAISAAIALAVAVLPPDQPVSLSGLVRVDAISRLFLAVINTIFLGVSVYVFHRVHTTPVLRSGIGRFVALALAFLAASNAVLVANHLLALWIALEASALAATPLIVRSTVLASRRASWHYLLFSSVALAVVLLGISCLGRGMATSGQLPTYFIDELLARGQTPTDRWTQLGVALIVLGLGTKLGLAPMYSWLPETYDESPPAVAALLGAVQFNCVLVVLFRVVEIYRPSHSGLLSGELLTMGLASMVVSTVSIIATRNIKRLIAYASINHAGVIAIGLGVGASASYGVLLYVLSNAFIKAILFLTAGNIKAHYHTSDARVISGLIKDLPYSGLFLMVGTFALLGLPPFGSFFGELLVLSSLVGSGQVIVFGTFCVLITMTFVATGRTVFPMIWGEPKATHDWPRQTLLGALPKLVFLAVLVVLGVYIPSAINSLIQQASTSVGGS